MAEWRKNGRAADIFSLGCVLLEVLVLHQDGTLKRLRVDRSTNNPAFHANLDDMDAWLPIHHVDDMSLCDLHLVKTIRSMLSAAPERRPSADQLLHNIGLADMMKDSRSSSIFGSCCRTPYISMSSHTTAMRLSREERGEIKRDLKMRSEQFHRATKLFQNAKAAQTQAEVAFSFPVSCITILTLNSAGSRNSRRNLQLQSKRASKQRVKPVRCRMK